MSLTVTNVFADGTTIDASKVNKNFDDVEAKFNAGVDATDLKAKYYRFALTSGTWNSDLTEYPDNAPGTLYEMEVPADGSFVIESVKVRLGAIAGGTILYRIALDTGSGYSEIVTASLSAAGFTSYTPTTTAIPGGAKLWVYVLPNLAANWSGLVGLWTTIWCKQVVKEA